MLAVPSEAPPDWPGEERRSPSLSSATWAVRAPLADWLRGEADGLEARNGRVRLLDVGCGPKPYYPFFAGRVDDYVGVDIGDNPAADLEGSVEALPVEDGSFDLVLCTQVLEHCADPAAAVRELFRVTSPGGRVLASTHGVQVYHPSPQDFWRWTHDGLRRLFAENGDWSSLTVAAAAGTATCLAMLVGTYVEIGTRRARVPPVARPLVSALNRAGRRLDRRTELLRDPRPGSLIANFHVTADVPAG
jgi:SAM-dependent methyltransferase